MPEFNQPYGAPSVEGEMAAQIAEQFRNEATAAPQTMRDVADQMLEGTHDPAAMESLRQALAFPAAAAGVTPMDYENAVVAINGGLTVKTPESATQDLAAIRAAVEAGNEEARKTIIDSVANPEETETNLAEQDAVRQVVDGIKADMLKQHVEEKRGTALGPVFPKMDQVEQERAELTQGEIIYDKMAKVVIPPDPPMDLDEEKKIMDVELTKLVRMPFVELHKYRSSSAESIENLEEVYRMKEAAPNIFAQMNVLEHTPLRGTPVAKFGEKYFELHRHGMLQMEMVDTILRRIASLEDVPLNSVGFLGYSMGQSCRRRIEEAKQAIAEGKNQGNYMERYIKRTGIVADAYENRTDFEFLLNKLGYPIPVYNILEELRKEGPEKAMAQVDKVLSPMFQDPHMTQARALIVAKIKEKGDFLPLDITNDNHVATLAFFFMYWLARVYSNEYESGRCAYVKTFITNIYDALADQTTATYDLPGGKELMWFTVSTMLALFNCIMDSTKASLKKTYDQLYEKTIGIYTASREATLKVSEAPTWTGDTSISSLMKVDPDALKDELLEELHCLHVHQQAQANDKIGEYLEPDGEEDIPDPDLEKDFEEADINAPEEDMPPESEEAPESDDDDVENPTGNHPHVAN